MTLEELEKTEGLNTENKLELPGKDISFLKTVVAFANGQGGKFLFGIRDEDHAVIGMDDETLFQDIDAITNIIADNCVPAIIPNVYPQTVQGKTIIVAEIPMGRQRPYYVKKLGMMDGTFIRISAESRQAPDYLVKELMFEGANRFFDKTVCLDLEASDKDIAKLCRSLKKTARYNCIEEGDKRKVKDVTPAQLLSWGILTQKDGKVVPTNAYALLTGHWRLPTMTQCALFKGVDKCIFLDKREYEGPVQDQQEEALQFVLKNIRLGARIRGLYRQDIYEIPSVAIRELLINCVLHRSYLDHGNIQVAIYDDRLEVFCPGKLPMDQTVERMQLGVSKIRNEALAKAFVYMNLIEAWGSGIKKINDALLDAGLQKMKIEDGNTFLRFTIFRNPNFNPEENEQRKANVTAPVNHENGTVTPENGTVTPENGTVSPVTDPVTAPVNLANGTANGTVNEKNGTVNSVTAPVNLANGTVSSINGTVNDTVNSNNGTVTLNNREKLVLHLLKTGEVLTVAQIKQKTGISERTIKRILKALVQKSLIQREGSDKTGRWIIL